MLELDWAVANALAFPLTRRVAFTRQAVEALDDAELESVAAHEPRRTSRSAEPLPSSCREHARSDDAILYATEEVREKDKPTSGAA